VVWSLVGHTCLRLPDNGQSDDQTARAGRQSSVTSHRLAAIFRRCLSDPTHPGTATTPSIADCCGLLAVTLSRQDDAMTRSILLASRRGPCRISVTTQATDVSEDQCRVDIHPVVNTAHDTLHTKQSAVHMIYTLSYINWASEVGQPPSPLDETSMLAI